MTQLDRKTTSGSPKTTSGNAFRLDKANAKIWGVCGGIANYFGIDATLVRIGFVAGTLIGFGSLLIVYLAIALIAD